ncbi:lambda-crystallin-like [Haliotis rubra]|uniref:lambda-crystallin-like n=1 Tax=Haliotis rubra TaxID=36100 RepID=UPI001EE61922|nr:lambda-crystallin-like [Haliotis rubra]
MVFRRRSSLEADNLKMRQSHRCINGQIGRSWALRFASAGYLVALYDVIPERVTRTLESLLEQLHSQSRDGLLRGTLGVEEQWGRIRGVQDLGECVTGAVWVQANPPSCSRVAELVPAPWTAPETVTRAQDLIKAIGQSPITLKKEIPGFILNRMQYAIMAESYRLVKGGFLSPDGVNKTLSAGLGRRYAFLGPFQTAHLNAEGFGSYCERYADMIHRVQQSFGAPQQMGGALAEHIQEEMAKEVPLDRLGGGQEKKGSQDGSAWKTQRRFGRRQVIEIRDIKDINTVIIISD